MLSCDYDIQKMWLEWGLHLACGIMVFLVLGIFLYQTYLYICDYDIQKKEGIHIFNLLDLQYDPTKMTPIAFYNQYRTMITNNLSRKDDIIKYKNNHKLAQDEQMSPMLEDLVLLDAVREIDIRLPAYIRSFYTHKLSKTDRLMDFKNDIMNNISKFIQELEKDEQLGSMKLMDAEPTLSAFRQGNQHRGRGGTTGGRGGTHRGRGGQLSHRPNNTPRTNKYCRLCHKCEMPREIYTGHNIGDARCTQLSFQDRQKLTQSSTLGSIVVQNDDDGITELATSFGYDEHLVDQSTDQVNIHEEEIDNEILDKNLSRINLAKLCYIKPEPSCI